MARRRMFSVDIVDTDAFLDMSTSAQALYFHLGMRADDDGFISNPKKIMRTCGSAEDDLKILLGKRFILPFESGICVIKHWKINNYIQSDRYKETLYLEEKTLLDTKENGSYTECIQSGYTGKVRLGKVSKELANKVRKSVKKKPMKEYNEPVVDYDSGEIVETKKPQYKKKMNELIAFAENETGKKFPNKIRQYTALKKLREMNKSPKEIKAKWKELQGKEIYKENGIDFWSLYNAFSKLK